MAAKVKALQQWCKIQCDGYRDVEIKNFTSSWKSGLAFCAIIHRYRPDLIDYDSLRNDDTFGNSKLAFDVALNELGIAALLDPEDMVIMTVPDKLCIITYVAQYYNYFHNKPKLGGPGVRVPVVVGGVKRPMRMTDIFPSPDRNKTSSDINNKQKIVAVAANNDNDDQKYSPAAKRRTIEDRCCICHDKVYLLERHYNSGKLYHRHCCREAERASTLKRNREMNASSSPFASIVSELGASGKNSGMSSAAVAPEENKSSIFGKSLKNKNDKENVRRNDNKEATAATSLVKSLFVPSKYKSPETASPSFISSSNAAKGDETSINASSLKYVSPKITFTGSTSSNYLTSASGGITSKATPISSLARSTTSSNVSTSHSHSSVSPSPLFGLKTSASPSTLVVTTPSAQKHPAESTVKYSASTTKSSTPATSTPFSNVLANKNTTIPRLDERKSPSPLLFSSTSKSSAAVTSSKYVSSNAVVSNRPTETSTSNSTPKYTSIFTTRSDAVVLPSSKLPGSISNTTTSAGSYSLAPKLGEVPGGHMPTFSLGSGEIVLAVKYGDKDSIKSGNTNASLLWKDGVGAGAGVGGSKKEEPSKSNKETGIKPEWQLEAERRQAERNGVYVDPEKCPQRPPTATACGTRTDAFVRNGKEGGVTNYRGTAGGSDGVMDRGVVGPAADAESSKKNATTNLLVILKKQLHKGGEVTKEEEKDHQDRMRVRVKDHRSDGDDEDDILKSWVMVSPPVSSSLGLTRNDAFKIADDSPSQENWKMFLEKGGFGFSEELAETNKRAFLGEEEKKIKKSSLVFPGISKIARNPSVPKRKVNAEEEISMNQIMKKLLDLDRKLRTVETKGRVLEEKIRCGTDEAMDEDEDDLMIEWFSLVKQKYEFVREESHLMYRRRQQELEELHTEIEYQLRCLRVKPEEEWTISEKQFEEILLKELLETVNLRNEIIDSMEVDRRRYLEEDKTIDTMMEASGISSIGLGNELKKKQKNKNKKKGSIHTLTSDTKGGKNAKRGSSFFKRKKATKSPNNSQLID